MRHVGKRCVCFGLFSATGNKHYDMDTILILKDISPDFPSTNPTAVSRKAFIDFNGISIKP